MLSYQVVGTETVQIWQARLVSEIRYRTLSVMLPMGTGLTRNTENVKTLQICENIAVSFEKDWMVQVFSWLANLSTRETRRQPPKV